MLDFTGLNWWAIVVATFVAFVLGGLWYGPLLFGKAWLAALGKTQEDIKPSPTPFIVSAVAALATCVVVAALLRGLEITGWLPGAMFGLVTGVGFIAAAMASDHAFGGFGWKLWAIESGYRVACAAIMGGILGIWV